MVTWFHQVKQLFLIPIPGVLTQNLGNIVRTWSAHWIITVCVLFLRLCYSGNTLYQQYENNLVQTWSALCKCIFEKLNQIHSPVNLLNLCNLVYQTWQV